MRARFALVAVLVLEATAVGAVATGGPTGAIDRHDPVGWLRRTDPETATLVVGRGLVLVVAGWLLLTTVFALVAALLAAGPHVPGPIRRGAGAVGRCAPRAIRHLVVAAVTVGVVTASAAPAPAAAPSSTPPSRTSRPAFPDAVRPAVAPLGPVRAGRASDSPLPPTVPTVPSAPAAPPAPPVSAAAPPPTPPAAGRTHRVVAGEHLWGIAESAVRAQTGGGDPVAVDRYWRALCDANRSRLASGDPDVVVPGEELELPPIV